MYYQINSPSSRDLSWSTFLGELLSSRVAFSSPETSEIPNIIHFREACNKWKHIWWRTPIIVGLPSFFSQHDIDEATLHEMTEKTGIVWGDDVILCIPVILVQYPTTTMLIYLPHHTMLLYSHKCLSLCRSLSCLAIFTVSCKNLSESSHKKSSLVAIASLTPLALSVHFRLKLHGSGASFHSTVCFISSWEWFVDTHWMPRTRKCKPDPIPTKNTDWISYRSPCSLAARVLA